MRRLILQKFKIMITIKVKSLPLEEVIRDIAEAFGTEYTESCEEYFLEIPLHMGEGSIRGINFDSGVGILQYDCLFKEDVELQFIINKVHPLKFLYCLHGQLFHRFENSKEEHDIQQYQEAIVASDMFNGHILRFKTGIRSVVNSVEITRKEFQKKIKCELITMDAKLQNLFNDVSALKTFYHDGFYSLKLADVFREMQEFEGKDFLKKLFLEGKAYQMLTEQIIQYEDDVRDVSDRTILRITEIKQIEAAASIVREQIADLNTIQSIAKEVGLNTNKLQDGFQKLYGFTVNNYVQKVRLDMIKELVLNTEYTMSEIVHQIGLTSNSYLSKIFKDEFGTTPSEYRKNYTNNLLLKRKVISQEKTS